MPKNDETTQVVIDAAVALRDKFREVEITTPEIRTVMAAVEEMQRPERNMRAVELPMWVAIKLHNNYAKHGNDDEAETASSHAIAYAMHPK